MGGEFFASVYDGYVAPRGSLAGRGTQSFFATLEYTTDESCDENCTTAVTGGQIYKIDESGRRQLAGAGAALSLDVSQGRMAIVRPIASVVNDFPDHAAPGAPVEIRDVLTGDLVTTFAPTGEVTTVSLSGSLAGVVVRDSAENERIEIYDLVTGLLLQAHSVLQDVPAELDIEGSRAVFRTGRVIRLLNIETGEATVLYRGRNRLLDPSIENGRVAWAENRKREGSWWGLVRVMHLG